MVIKRFDPAHLGKLDAFRLAARQYGSSRLRLAFSIDVGSRVGRVCENKYGATASWFSEIDPLTALPTRYFNSGVGERLHRLSDRSCLPECIDNHPNRVLSFRVVVVPTVRPSNPTNGQPRNDLASFRFGHSRLHHDFRSFTVLKTSDHSGYLRNNRIVRVRGINQPAVAIE